MVNPPQHHAQRPAFCLLALVTLVALSSCRLASTSLHSSTPTPHDCGTPTLTIGTAAFTIRAFRPSTSGFLGIPSASPKVAFWIVGTEAHLVFVISPAAENVSLEKSLLHSIAGQSAKATWADCTSTTYALSPAEKATSGRATLPDQSTPGITIFFQQDSSGLLSVVNGNLARQQVTVIDTPTSGPIDTPAFPTSNIPMPDPKSIQAEITLPDVKASPDGKSIQLSLSMLNVGESSFTLSKENVALTAQDGTQVNLLSSQPGLPLSIKPRTPTSITFTFAKPSSSTTTLQIFDVEYDIEGY